MISQTVAESDKYMAGLSAATKPLHTPENSSLSCDHMFQVHRLYSDTRSLTSYSSHWLKQE